MTALPSPQQLRYLLALDEHRHFGRAADACVVTQSTLSAGILALERQLDAAILAREAGKRVVFTTLGAELVERARTALVALEAVAEAAAAARGPMTGPLKLGVIPTIGPFLLPRLMPAVRRAFPQLRLFLREDTTERLLDRLAAGRLDVALLALPCACAGAETLAIARDELLVAMPAAHPLAARDSVPAALLAGERVLLMEDGHCLRDQVLAACSLRDASTGAGGDGPAGEAFAATSVHTLVQMVAGGLGLTLLPQMAITEGVTAGAGLALRPIAGGGAARTIALAWRPGAARAADYRALGQALGASMAGMTGAQ